MAQTGNPLEDMIAHIAKGRAPNDELTTQQVVAAYRSQITDHKRETREMKREIGELRKQLAAANTAPKKGK